MPTRGGGGLILVAKKFNAAYANLTFYSHPLPALVHLVCGKLCIGNASIYIFAIYGPLPTKCTDFENILECFENLPLFKKCNFCTLGDFKIPAFYDDANYSKVLLLNNFMFLFPAHQNNNILIANVKLVDLMISNVRCSVNF